MKLIQIDDFKDFLIGFIIDIGIFRDIRLGRDLDIWRGGNSVIRTVWDKFILKWISTGHPYAPSESTYHGLVETPKNSTYVVVELGYDLHNF